MSRTSETAANFELVATVHGLVTSLDSLTLVPMHHEGARGLEALANIAPPPKREPVQPVQPARPLGNTRETLALFAKIFPRARY